MWLRFWAKVAFGDGCWEWQGYRRHARRRKGKGSILSYGQFRLHGQMQPAHVVAFTWRHGPCPSNRVVGHTCDNPSCVRPSHLRAITQSSNVRDSWARTRKTP